ncbi:PBP1A family penicillin-binding protein [Alteribacillus iranensis]|uniref:Penicillin-binding protein 1A n=1 Tax=Alteribacillus iranensis TaxID=930128 RepID=A0A1I1ZSR6_9BACI|nr:PBP1A family penicillin-binding protein [Alteribacillus iranensis]SFE34676.1 penicillin-binding protein 1A [Alteribacillus iranensis]
MSDNYRSRTERRKAQETTKRKNKPKKTKSNKPIWKKIVISLLIALVLLMGAGIAGAAIIISGAPPLDPDELVFSQAAEIYDQNDEEVTRLQSSENRDLVDIDNVPEHAKAAFVAVEDVRFYDHFGIDIKRLFGAVAANFTEGFGAEGASTITQQVVKNAFLSQEKTITRKVQEQYLAVRLEQQYSKNQILEMYLNLIYFNKGAHGIGEAASVYFNKSDVSELTIEDAALLAAIPRRPSYYDPTINPQEAKDRRDMIINLMVEHGFISEQDGETAKQVTIEQQIDFNPPQNDPVYDSFISQVQSELEQIDGITTNDLYTAGLKVYTTLDTDAQKYAEQVIQTNEYISHYPDSEEFQVGFTLLDTESGAIKAMVGNRQSQDVSRGFNYAARSSAQPGSTIKPILDYGPAIEYNKWSTYHQIEDSPHQYSNGGDIRNYSGTYSGNVSMREALVRSLNIPAVKALQQTGLERAGDFARNLGIPVEQVYESYALGGFSNGVSSLDMAGAYAAFGNGGMYTEPYTVRKIEFPDGRVMELEPSSERVMQDYTAYMITDVLKDVVTDPRGTGRAANIPGLPLAGKTGTTNFTNEEHQKFNIPAGGDPDVWFTGYTTQYTAAVWTGFSGNRGENYLINNESNIAKEVFRLIMSHVSENVETPDFTKPESVEEIAIDVNTGRRASAFTPSSQTVTELFVKGTGPEAIPQPEEEEEDPESEPNEITGLNAVYEEESDTIQVTWNYNQEELEELAFQVEHQVDNSGYETISTQNEMSFSLTGPEQGTTHRFRVTVIDGEGPNASTSAEVQVNVPDPDAEEETEEDEEEGNDEEENLEDENPSNGNNEGDDPENGQNENGNDSPNNGINNPGNSPDGNSDNENDDNDNNGETNNGNNGPSSGNGNNGNNSNQEEEDDTNMNSNSDSEDDDVSTNAFPSRSE